MEIYWFITKEPRFYFYTKLLAMVYKNEINKKENKKKRKLYSTCIQHKLFPNFVVQMIKSIMLICCSVLISVTFSVHVRKYVCSLQTVDTYKIYN